MPRPGDKRTFWVPCNVFLLMILAVVAVMAVI